MSKSAAFLDQAKQDLLARKKELTSQLSTGAEKDTNTQVKDVGDEALSSSMDKLQNSLEQAEIDELNLINAALERIAHGDYGTCIDCGEAISDKRLAHSPYAARCIGCQEELESQP